MATTAQMQPHLAGTEPGHEPMLPRDPDQVGDLGVAHLSASTAAGPWPRSRCWGRIGHPCSGEHGADRLDPQPARSCPFGQPLDQVVAVFVDERDQYLGWRSSSAAKKADALLRI